MQRVKTDKNERQNTQTQTQEQSFGSSSTSPVAPSPVPTPTPAVPVGLREGGHTSTDPSTSNMAYMFPEARSLFRPTAAVYRQTTGEILGTPNPNATLSHSEVAENIAQLVIAQAGIDARMVEDANALHERTLSLLRTAYARQQQQNEAEEKTAEMPAIEPTSEMTLTGWSNMANRQAERLAASIGPQSTLDEHHALRDATLVAAQIVALVADEVEDTTVELQEVRAADQADRPALREAYITSERVNAEAETLRKKQRARWILLAKIVGGSSITGGFVVGLMKLLPWLLNKWLQSAPTQLPAFPTFPTLPGAPTAPTVPPAAPTAPTLPPPSGSADVGHGPTPSHPNNPTDWSPRS